MSGNVKVKYQIIRKSEEYMVAEVNGLNTTAVTRFDTYDEALTHIHAHVAANRPEVHEFDAEGNKIPKEAEPAKSETDNMPLWYDRHTGRLFLMRHLTPERMGFVHLDRGEVGDVDLTKRYWLDKHGELIALKDMTDLHLRNLNHYLRKFPTNTLHLEVIRELRTRKHDALERDYEDDGEDAEDVWSESSYQAGF